MKRPIDLIRAGSALIMLITIVSGVTFATLRSQNNVLSGSRMSSASADLTISRSATGPWMNTAGGFEFVDIMPGGEPGPKTGTDLYLRNNGTTNMTLQYALNLTKIVNMNSINLQKAKVVITDASGQTVYGTQSIHQLGQALGAGTPLATELTLPKNSVTTVKIMMQLEEGAVTNSSSQLILDNIDIVFSGVAQAI